MTAEKGEPGDDKRKDAYQDPSGRTTSTPYAAESRIRTKKPLKFGHLEATGKFTCISMDWYGETTEV